uniref:Uncharacterized protein n=1 Tax=Oscillatoriales cyanobacterium SpSt-402 TaxID=2282168 RepID=A0A832H2S3_9CYAN
MRNLEPLVLEGYSRDEVIHLLSHQRRVFSRPPISVPTFYRWIGELAISPKLRYSESDLQRLMKLCVHYAQGGKTSNLPDI